MASTKWLPRKAAEEEQAANDPDNMAVFDYDDDPLVTGGTYGSAEELCNGAIELDISSDVRDPTSFDVAIRTGRGGWDGLTEYPLIPVDVTPMVAPSLLAARRLDAPEDLVDFDLRRIPIGASGSHGPSVRCRPACATAGHPLTTGRSHQRAATSCGHGSLAAVERIRVCLAEAKCRRQVSTIWASDRLNNASI